MGQRKKMSDGEIAAALLGLFSAWLLTAGVGVWLAGFAGFLIGTGAFGVLIYLGVARGARKIEKGKAS